LYRRETIYKRIAEFNRDNINNRWYINDMYKDNRVIKCVKGVCSIVEITEVGHYIVNNKLFYTCQNTKENTEENNGKRIECSEGTIYEACNATNVERFYTDTKGKLNICLDYIKAKDKVINVVLNSNNNGNYIIKRNEAVDIFDIGKNSKYNEYGIIKIKENSITLNSNRKFKYIYTNGDNNKLLEKSDTCEAADINEYECNNGKCIFIY